MPKNILNKNDESQKELTQLEERGVKKLSPAAITLMAEFFKVLSEPSRLQILCTLKSGSKNVSQIIEDTALGQANVSKHLKVLTQASIVTRTQQGINVFYEISNPFIFELCELVCDSISLQIEQQNKNLEHLKNIKSSF
ncbi:MAG: helix-turn-helix transcriptional regulator [Richelia sp. SL_2_1]|nr:helix-turn-helix transcriptional regulator [Richelia sp. SM2_1_7]NJM19415.1 helix-turn-helix transcriptional regulator [Richelia sp. SM1_7_0]NJN08644.1 helix-turn-helix transcriptional regulator [Richelia sp. RM1_1_1]NJO27739.1 helix-turn-helix transcriptional regulator [Richelia sp. SL_2_1]